MPKWIITVEGYGSFEFEGTEEEAEEMRAHKARWERGVGTKLVAEGEEEDVMSDDRTAGNEIGEHLAEGHPRGCGKAIGDLAAKLLHANKHIFSLQRTVLALTKMLEDMEWEDGVPVLTKEDRAVLTDAKPIAAKLLEEAREEVKRYSYSPDEHAACVEQAVADERKRILAVVDMLPQDMGHFESRVRAQLEAPAEEA